MEKMPRKPKTGHDKTSLPGAIYARNGRYWWKVQLPGESKPTGRPLVNPGSKFATTDYSAAVDLAQNLYQQSIYQSQNLQQGFAVSNIASLVKAYLVYAEQYYRDPDGNPTHEITNTRYSFKPLTELFAALPVNDFGPLKLFEVRNRMIVLKWSRKLINERINRIRRMFKWAVSRQLVSPIIHHGLVTVEGLKRGRSATIELEKRKPAEEQHVYAVLPYTTPVVATMVELQLLTGMRPAELCQLRPCDLDRSGAVWHYRPEKHKNAYREIERIVSIGPRGQELLQPFLLRHAESYCFSPIESEKYRRAKLTENRVTSPFQGNTVGSNRKDNPQFRPSDHYDSESYRKSVQHAITAANKVIKEDAKEKGIEKPVLIPSWTPYQLRHTAATKVRKEMGYETAGATLGHTNMSATAIYAERNQGLADEAARRFG